MKKITIKIPEWSDIKEWWRAKRGPKQIRENAKNALDYVGEVWKSKVETIIEAHYPELGDGADEDRYTDLVIDLRTTVEEICEDAKKFI